jgi:hypothetical protein
MKSGQRLQRLAVFGVQLKGRECGGDVSCHVGSRLGRWSPHARRKATTIDPGLSLVQ